MAANQPNSNSLNNKNPEPLILTYLAHKGYKQTEAMFRHESTRNFPSDQNNDTLATNFLNYSNYPNYPNYSNYTNINPDIYKQSYSALRAWIEGSLDKFKVRFCLICLYFFFFVLIIIKIRTNCKEFYGRYLYIHISNLYQKDFLNMVGEIFSLFSLHQPFNQFGFF
jgi:hypothetical protein